MNQDILGGPEHWFISEVAEWLRLTNDPRLLSEGGRVVINEVCGACADFCGFMARIEAAGGKARDWRNFLNLDTACSD